MSFRDHQWYLNAIEAQTKVVDSIRTSIDASIECGEFSAAALKCDGLKDSLIKLNDLSNNFADKHG